MLDAIGLFLSYLSNDLDLIVIFYVGETLFVTPMKEPRELFDLHSFVSHP
jgi:hypothetical protein